MTSCISVEELQSLSQSWKVAYVSMIISKAAPLSDLEFNLDKVRGKVVTCEEVKIPASQTIVIKGLIMITGHCKHVHVLMESSPKCVNVFFLGNTSEQRPGKSDVNGVIQNRSGKDMNLKAGTEIGTVITAKIVLTTQINNGFDLDEKERVPCMSAQVESTNIPGKTHQGSSDPRDMLQKLDLSGIEEWEPHLQQEAEDLICEFACIFSQNDLDLGKLSIVKHSISK